MRSNCSARWRFGKPPTERQRQAVVERLSSTEACHAIPCLSGLEENPLLPKQVLSSPVGYNGLGNRCFGRRILSTEPEAFQHNEL